MLQFSNPAALWFLALIIPVLLLYLLKRRRQDRIVPSTLLWKQVLDDTQAYTPFQRLRSNLLLLLQILIIVLLTALLAQPYFAGASKQSRKWILIIDRSASMQATDEKPGRFEAAKAKLRETMNSIPPVDEVMLVAVASEASILQNFTFSHDEIKRKMAELETEDVAADWEQVVTILKPLLKDSPKPVVVVASDFANFPSNLQSFSFNALPVGKPVGNIAITKAAIEDSAPGLQEQLLYFQLKNYSSERKLAEVELEANGDLLDAFEFTMEPNGSAEKTCRITLPAVTQLKIHLKPDDSFPLDNEFVLITRPRQQIPVRLEVANPFLKHALDVLPAVRVTREGSITISESQQQGPGIYFLQGQTEHMAPIVQWNQAAAPLRFIDAGLWRISNYQVLKIPGGAETLLETSDGIVAYLEDRGGKRQIILGFKLDDSNLPLLAGFPIFLQNALVWIEEGLQPRLPTVTTREHKKEGVISDGKGYVNFADENESDLVPAKIRTRSAAESRIATVRQDFSLWFLLALLTVVMLEWWAFHRKG